MSAAKIATASRIAAIGLAFASSATATAAEPPLYISASGSDDNDGSSPSRAVKSPTRIKQLIGNDTAPRTIYFLPGTYRLDSPFVIRTKSPTTWTAREPGTVIFDGGGHVPIGIYIKGENVTLSNVVVRNMLRDGIRVEASRDITIQYNLVEDIVGNGWSQGGIHGLQTAINTKVYRNTVRDTGYAGILFDASPNGNISNVSVIANDVRRTCQRVKDCGAIYSIGRTPRSNGFRVLDNVIVDYGPVENETKAIYFDDGLSGAYVANNFISGRGTYAFQIHGGKGNIIEDNEVVMSDYRAMILYQDVKLYMTDMSRNIFRGNDIRGLRDLRHIIVNIGTIPNELSFSENRVR